MITPDEISLARKEYIDGMVVLFNYEIDLFLLMIAMAACKNILGMIGTDHQ